MSPLRRRLTATTAEEHPPEEGDVIPVDYAELADYEQPHEIMQIPGPGPAVPVEARGPLPVEIMPGMVGVMKNELIVDGAPARMILGRDPRRRRVILWAVSTVGSSIVLAQTESEANAGDGSSAGAILDGAGSVSMRVELGIVDELWARSRDAATASGVLTIITELWTR